LSSTFVEVQQIPAHHVGFDVRHAVVSAAIQQD
jgi:hypothetical protein